MNQTTPNEQRNNLPIPSVAMAQNQTESNNNTNLTTSTNNLPKQKLPSDAKVINTGSATGNPRNKCALKPGHSLMDWVRLGNAGCDLAGTKGVIRPISSDELKKHNTRNDAWLAIRGKVYNVTAYMDFHPGGIDELMKGVGLDATKLFDDVHAWVNYEQLLAKCFIGPLRTTVVLNLGIDNTKQTKTKKSLTFSKSPQVTSAIGGFLAPQVIKLAQATSFTKAIQIISPAGITAATSTSPSSSPSATPSPTTKTDVASDAPTIEIVPRFDWLQNINDLSIIFYTKALCNPGVTVHYETNSNCDIKIIILIDYVIHVFKFKFSHDVQWPGVNAKVNTDTGKIEVIFKKLESNIWCNYGQLNRWKSTDLAVCTFMYDILEREQITHDSYALYLKPRERIYQLFPIGYHVSISTIIDGNEVTRSYTPVPLKFTNNLSIPSYYIALLIKSYEYGILSPHIVKPIPHENGFEISHPKGKSPLQSIKLHKRIGILAAGSGITPMLSILIYLLGRSRHDLLSINLLFFNKTENDIWCKQMLESLADKDDRFSLTHILSEPPATWTGEYGRMSDELAKRLGDSESLLYSTVCFICGPTPFNDSCSKLLSMAGFPNDNLQLFRG